MAWSVSFCPWKTKERRWREDAYLHTVYSHIYEFSLWVGSHSRRWRHRNEQNGQGLHRSYVFVGETDNKQMSSRYGGCQMVPENTCGEQ